MAILQADPTQAITQIISENKALAQANEKLAESLAELKEQNIEIKARLKKLEMFEDLLDDEDWEWYKLPAIKTKIVWRQLRGCVKQVFKTENDMYVRAVLEAMILYGSRIGHWVSIRKEFFDNVGRGDGNE